MPDRTALLWLDEKVSTLERRLVSQRSLSASLPMESTLATMSSSVERHLETKLFRLRRERSALRARNARAT